MSKKKKLIIIVSTVIVVLLAVGGLVYLYLKKSGYDPRVERENVKINTRQQKKCEDLGGYFEVIHNECTNVSALQCADIGGEFVECGSACRHNPTASTCTLQCVAYCQL